MQQMPASLFREWQAFYALEPFGSERAELHAALAATLLAETNRDPKKRARRYEMQDFALPAGLHMEHTVRARPKQGWQQQLQIVEMLNAAFGGADLRKKGEPKQ